MCLFSILVYSCEPVQKPIENTYHLLHFENRSNDYKELVNAIIRFYAQQQKGFDTIKNLLPYQIPVKRVDSTTFSIPIDYSLQRRFLSQFEDSTLSKIWYLARLYNACTDQVCYGYALNPYNEFMIQFDEIRDEDYYLFQAIGQIEAIGDHELDWYKPLSFFEYADTMNMERKLFWIVVAFTLNDQLNRQKEDSIGPKMIVHESFFKGNSNTGKTIIFEEDEEIDQNGPPNTP